jgi:hypothetical protein
MFKVLLFLGLALCFLHGGFDFPMLPFLISFMATLLLTFAFSYRAELDARDTNGDNSDRQQESENGSREEGNNAEE